MIWEIDDDCDKCVNWHEFQAMFYRCRGDKTGAFVAGVVSTFSEFSCYLLLNIGYEPRRFFNVVEFLLNDKDDSGSVSLEEATQILYLRFGKYSLDAVSILFAFRAREQCHVIFNNAVMHQSKIVSGHMRMGVGLLYSTVGRPAGVGNTKAALNRICF